jgi:Transport and Golgi organisation 2
VPAWEGCNLTLGDGVGSGGVCTVLLRFAPGDRWPVLAGAVRDEFMDRPWDAPGHHWDGAAARLLGGRDLIGGGTWLAVDPDPRRPALAALLNGPPLPPPADGVRPTRGTLALSVLTGGAVPDAAAIARYDAFHLLLATQDRAELWSWEGETPTRTVIPPGDHILVNHGLDAVADPLVPYFLPLLERTPAPDPKPGQPPAAAWGSWLDLLAGDGLDPADPRALIVRREFEGRTYGSSSASLVALSPAGVRYDFTADPRRTDSWFEVDTSRRPG